LYEVIETVAVLFSKRIECRLSDDARPEASVRFMLVSRRTVAYTFPMSGKLLSSIDSVTFPTNPFRR
jgi:hypothetical protein